MSVQRMNSGDVPLDSVNTSLSRLKLGTVSPQRETFMGSRI